MGDKDCITNTQQLAMDLMGVCYPLLTDGVPYLVYGHSVGTWVGFEFLSLARKIGLPMPKAGFFMAFPAPHLPFEKRPWPRSKKMNTEQIQGVLRNWDSGHFT